MTGLSTRPPTTLASAPSIPATTIRTRARKSLFSSGEEAMDTCDSYIVEALCRASQGLRRDHRFFGNRDIRRSRTHDQHDALRQRAWPRAQDNGVCLGMINRLREQGLDGRKGVLTGAGGEDITAGGPDVLYDLAYLLDSLALAEYHFGESLP